MLRRTRMATHPISIAIAGSTEYTRRCAEALAGDSQFVISEVLTPAPKKIGRKQLLAENPLHHWAKTQPIPITLIHEKINQSIKTELLARTHPDLLLVVDFGYFIPRWLLEWPRLAPLNIHPSKLPRWRGSSPGQFALLYGDTQSAVTLMIMNEAFDAGPLLSQLPLRVEATWTAREYYDQAFGLIVPQLPALLRDVATGRLQPTPQPVDTPTPIATKLARDDGKISWELLVRLVDGTQPPDQIDFGHCSPILLDAFSASGNIYSTVEAAIRAFSPWPGVWTEVPLATGETKRMKILRATLTEGELQKPQLTLIQVQLDGKQPTNWNHIKQTVKMG